MYEVIKVVNDTKIEIIERKFRFKFSAQRAADSLNSAAKPTGFSALIGTGQRWQVQDSKTVTAMLASAMEAVKTAERIAAEVGAELEKEDPRSTQEIVMAMDEGLALDTKPKRTRKPRTGSAA